MAVETEKKPSFVLLPLRDELTGLAECTLSPDAIALFGTICSNQYRGAATLDIERMCEIVGGDEGYVRQVVNELEEDGRITVQSEDDGLYTIRIDAYGDDSRYVSPTVTLGMQFMKYAYWPGMSNAERCVYLVLQAFGWTLRKRYLGFCNGDSANVEASLKYAAMISETSFDECQEALDKLIDTGAVRTMKTGHGHDIFILPIAPTMAIPDITEEEIEYADSCVITRPGAAQELARNGVDLDGATDDDGEEELAVVDDATVEPATVCGGRKDWSECLQPVVTEEELALESTLVGLWCHDNRYSNNIVCGRIVAIVKTDNDYALVRDSDRDGRFNGHVSAIPVDRILSSCPGLYDSVASMGKSFGTARIISKGGAHAA